MLPGKFGPSILVLVLIMVSVTPAFAGSTEATYDGNLPFLLFIGFCILLTLAQLIVAVLILFGTARSVITGMHKSKAVGLERQSRLPSLRAVPRSRDQFGHHCL